MRLDPERFGQRRQSNAMSFTVSSAALFAFAMMIDDQRASDPTSTSATSSPMMARTTCRKSLRNAHCRPRSDTPDLIRRS